MLLAFNSNLKNENKHVFKKYFCVNGRTCAQGIGFAIILYGFIFISESDRFPGTLWLIPCLGTVLIIAGHGGKFTRFFSVPLMVWVGGMSYSLYLWHWPVLALFRYVTEKYFLEFHEFYFIIPIIFAVSYFSWRLIEAPFLMRQFPAKRYFFYAVFLVAIFTRSAIFKTDKQLNSGIHSA